MHGTYDVLNACSDDMPKLGEDSNALKVEQAHRAWPPSTDINAVRAVPVRRNERLGTAL